MKIGELAHAAQTQVETIRFYEREGLLPQVQRSGANYRVYEAAHVERLRFIRHCRSLDMTLEEVRVLLRFKDAPGQACGDVDALLEAHIGHVAARIRDLRQLERQLKLLRAQCNGVGDAANCGILSRLAHAASAPAAAGRAGSAHVGGAHGRGTRTAAARQR